MTYKDLLKHLKNMDEYTLDQTVTVFLYSQDEYFGVESVDYSVGTDVIDDNHFILVVK